MRMCCDSLRGEWPYSVYDGPAYSASKVIVPPPVEPLTLDEVKLDRRVDNDLDDSLLNALIGAAREYCEGYAGQSLVTQTREVTVALYVPGMPLPYGPVQSVVPPSATAPPYVVQYIAGYPPITTEGEEPDYVSNIPESYKVAMKLLIGHWYENREETIVGTTSTTLAIGVHALIGWYRQRLGAA